MNENPLFELEGFCVVGPRGSILRVPSLSVAARKVTAVLGPVGTGKSLLLRALAGVRPPAPLGYEGAVRFRGEPASLDRDFPREGVLWIGQARGAESDELSVDDVVRRGGHAQAILLDEIERRVPEERRGELALALRGLCSHAGVVLVTHDLEFARAVADDVHLVCAGNVVASAGAPTFFEVPPSDLAARFVRDGNCWPTVEAPELPTSFRWVEPGKLGGTGRPGLLRDVDEDLSSMALAGVTELVTLTEEPQPAARLRSFGLTSRHFPIQDMGVPAIGATLALCRDITRSIAGGECVAVHCSAGLGRTGTILAAVLVFRDEIGAAEAIARVRTVEKRMIQNRAQEHFVERLAEALGR